MGTVIAETTVHLTAATGGPLGGVELAEVDAGGAVVVRIQLLSARGAERRWAHLTVSGWDFVGGPCAICFPACRSWRRHVPLTRFCSGRSSVR